MGSSSGFTLAAWSIVREEMVERISGARVWRTRDVLGVSWMEEKRSSSCGAGERNSRSEERISRYGWIVSGAEVLNWIVR
jgi:hypothetical protein